MSNKFDFTEGEWYYQEGADDYTHIIRVDKKNLKRVFLCQLTQDSSGESKANARLIVCSPEMAMVLIEDVKLICQNCQQRDYRQCWKEKGFCKTYDKRVSLIEKATGKTWNEINSQE